jgi:ATP-binding cassette subfamily G (WHITE) protein 2
VLSFIQVCRLYGGFFLPPSKLPAYFSWLDALSFVKYSYTGIALNELTGSFPALPVYSHF